MRPTSLNNSSSHSGNWNELTVFYKNDFFFVSQEDYSPEDPANPCANYPTQEYESYADCDDDFVRRSLPPDLKPFWTVDNISEATNTYSINTEDYENMYSGVLCITYINTAF